MTEVITIMERQLLRRLEQVIDKNLPTFVTVANALKEIRDAKLYRETHSSFELYCKERFNIAKSHAYRMIEAAEEISRISHLPGSSQITTMAHVEAIAQVPPENKPEVLKDIARQNKQRITAKSIQDANKKLSDTVKQIKEKPITIDAEIVRKSSENPAGDYNHPAARIRSKIFSAANKLDGVLSELNTLSVLEGGEFLKKDLEMIRQEVVLVKNRIRASVFYAVCPGCGGKKCKTCLNTGWISKSTIPMLSTSERAKLEVV